MNQDTILQSNLLDIIFENRNKDYGAYTLRKKYNSRLRIAVFSMMGICILFSLQLLSENSTTVFTQSPPNIFTPDPKLSVFHSVTNAGRKSAAKITHTKKISETERPPKIVASNIINNLPATPPEIQPSLTGTGISEVNFPSDLDGHNNGKLNENGRALAQTLEKPAKSDPLGEAEIMPQYPGGTKALLAFLKKNIHSPGDVEEGEDVSVKIKFVVNYNGKLESFNIVKSGGEVFDNEVLRVLKKMPLWIPGKSNGQNVSVYYVVPVKFLNQVELYGYGKFSILFYLAAIGLKN